MHDLQRVGTVAIGRNEGERLKRCLRSLPSGVRAVVYVDSGSTDESVAFAKSVGAAVIELDMSVPFTAARARNAGWQLLATSYPDISFIQFLDGDCELDAGWMDAALDTMASAPDAAVVCGRRREVAPDASVYNRLCDMEWDTPVGEADACGGDALFRLAALTATGGYDPSLIAGEEPDLCLRLRRSGYRVLRIDHEMTRHDAAMTRFSQWWMRNVRAGHACAEGCHRHGDGPERYQRHRVLSNLAWGVGVPGAALLMAPPTLGMSFSLLGLHAALYQRVKKHRLACGDSNQNAAAYARHLVLGKLAQSQGILQFHYRRLRGREAKLIEYK